MTEEDGVMMGTVCLLYPDSPMLIIYAWHAISYLLEQNTVFPAVPE